MWMKGKLVACWMLLTVIGLRYLIILIFKIFKTYSGWSNNICLTETFDPDIVGMFHGVMVGIFI